MALEPQGAYAYGLRIGRRSADLLLVDFLGTVVAQISQRYAYPVPQQIEAFCRDGIATLGAQLTATQAGRVVGLGVASPFEIWNWLDELGAPCDEARNWLGYRFDDGFAKLTDLPCPRFK